MRFGSAALAVSAGVLVLGVFVGAQDERKPGLWEITTTMTWQQSPFPAGMQMPPAAAAAFGGAPHTIQYCLTQAMIDKYGAPMPQSRGECTLTNVAKTATGMTADMVCTGHMNGKASIESHWSNGTATGKVHFTGSMQMGPNPTPIEWTSESTSVYKGADCGSVQPPPMPKEQ
ncbi:MAG TPA: DUF3617 domain-containing protein [Terracidiphilus sp.]|nr:DUF3617 domain-containing protein [Terracidiphilus sp.]